MKKHQYLYEITNICLHNHLTVDQIFGKIKKTYPKVGISTIYRNVEEMTKDGKLVKIKGNSGKHYFEANIGKHGHFFCTKSGKIYDIQIDNLKYHIPDNYKVENMEINFYGTMEN